LETLAELEHTFKFNDAIIRHLVFATKTSVSAQSPMMREEKSKSLIGDSKVEDKTKKKKLLKTLQKIKKELKDGKRNV